MNIVTTDVKKSIKYWKIEQNSGFTLFSMAEKNYKIQSTRRERAGFEI